MAQTYSDVQQRRNFQNMIPVVQEVVVDFSYEVEYQIICAFQASFSFILVQVDGSLICSKKLPDSFI